jgi:hypothetical protein
MIYSQKVLIIRSQLGSVNILASVFGGSGV